MSAVAAFTTALAVAAAAADRERIRRYPKTAPKEPLPAPLDSFPLPLQGVEIAPNGESYACACGHVSEEPELHCKGCGLTDSLQPANVVTLESHRLGCISVVIDQMLPEIGRLLMAAASCACDCRRRRVLLRAARVATENLVRMVGEDELGPSASDDQSLTEREFIVLDQGRDERAYGDYLVQRASHWEEFDAESAEERAHKENDRIDRERREVERLQIVAAFAIECPACKAKPDEECSEILDASKEFSPRKYDGIDVALHPSRYIASERVTKNGEAA